MTINPYERFAELKRYTDRIGSIYGTEDFSVYLYSVIKMMKPKTVVELGTGLGSTMLWAGLALDENGDGKVYTVDDGSEWHRLKTASDQIGDHYEEEYADFVNGLIRRYRLQDRVEFLNKTIDVVGVNDIDIVFSDFAHGVFDVTKLLVDYIPKMNDHAKIYIDSASTHYPSYMALNRIVDILNSGKMPRVFRDAMGSERHLESRYNLEKLKRKIEDSEFRIDHIIENKDRNQNSTCCITMSPIDVFPYPRKNIRSV